MAAKDLYHNTVRTALEKDGWTITNDPLTAVGQYIVYEDILELSQPERNIYLAIREEVYLDIFSEPIGQLLLNKKRLKLIVFEPSKEIIVRWID
jgi:XisH protein